MHRCSVHSKAPDNFRNSPDFSRYVRWENKNYPVNDERAPHVPDEKKIVAYHQINKTLRIRLCHVSRLPDSPRKYALIKIIDKRLDDNMGRILHERDPENCPDLRQEFVARTPVQKEKPEAVPKPVEEERKGILLRLPVLRRFPNPEAEPIFTRKYAHAV